jgi:hypothetical protein
MPETITWNQYLAQKEKIWTKHFDNANLTHEERGAAIKADLAALPPVRG